MLYRHEVAYVIREPNTFESIKASLEEHFQKYPEETFTIKLGREKVVFVGCTSETPTNYDSVLGLGLLLSEVADILFQEFDPVGDIPVVRHLSYYLIDSDHTDHAYNKAIENGLEEIAVDNNLVIENYSNHGYLYLIITTPENDLPDAAVTKIVRDLVESIMPGSFVLEYPEVSQL